MPRRNHKRKRRTLENGYLSSSYKPGGKRRPKGWHNGVLQGEKYAEADRAFRQAEEEAA